MNKIVKSVSIAFLLYFSGCVVPHRVDALRLADQSMIEQSSRNANASVDKQENPIKPDSESYKNNKNNELDQNAFLELFGEYLKRKDFENIFKLVVDNQSTAADIEKQMTRLAAGESDPDQKQVMQGIGVILTNMLKKINKKNFLNQLLVILIVKTLLVSRSWLLTTHLLLLILKKI